MDIITHAVVGAAMGANFGFPIVGAMVASLPDVVLGIKRKQVPNAAYRLTHSALGPFLVYGVGTWVDSQLAFAIALAWCSHIVLDIPTHGRVWSPQLLYPFSKFSLSIFEEWEFFNAPWFFGLVLAGALCLAL